MMLIKLKTQIAAKERLNNMFLLCFFLKSKDCDIHNSLDEILNPKEE